ncbi:hypothetical protein TcWFU_003587 [Taenia crassiceps]
MSVADTHCRGAICLLSECDKPSRRDCVKRIMLESYVVALHNLVVSKGVFPLHCFTVNTSSFYDILQLPAITASFTAGFV